MKRLLICISILIIGASCSDKSPGPMGSDVEYSQTAADSQLQSISRPDVLTVFFTGNELGALKPCGCSGGQLGGLDRRSAIFRRLPHESRLIVDTGVFVKSDAEQDLIKFNVIIRALGLIGYDVVNLREKDIEIGRNLDLLDSIGSMTNIITACEDVELNLPSSFTADLLLKGKDVSVTLAAFDPETRPVEAIRELFPVSSQKSVNILILNYYDPDIISSIAKNAPFVDCIVCSAESDEPILMGNPNDRPLVFSVGRYGRHICGVQISEDGRNKRKLEFKFFDIKVEEYLEQEVSLIDLYSDYQQIVKQHNLLEKYPRLPLPNGLKYAGSESCASCHQYEYIEWMGKDHANAFATLERVGSQYDPECVICHVIGMDYDSGYISEEKTPQMKDVGCENCHGPGSAHNLHPYESKTTITEPNSVCIKCHTPEHSGDYAGNEEEKLQKIKHWLEPNEPVSVQY